MDYPTPPHDAFAEEYVLASCLKRPELVDQCRLQPHDFYHLAHREAWAAILDVGAGLDELGEALHYGSAYLALWQADWSRPTEGALGAAARVRDCARHRDLLSMVQQLAERPGTPADRSARTRRACCVCSPDERDDLRPGWLDRGMCQAT